MIEIQDLLYQLRLSEQASTQLFEKRLGISLTRYQILLFLLENSPCNQMSVQERLKIDQAALTRHFKILEKEELARPSVSSLFKNQGIYNALLGVFLLYGIYFSQNLEIVTIFVLFVIGAAAYGSLTADKKIILKQGGPAILALISILLFK